MSEATDSVEAKISEGGGRAKEFVSCSGAVSARLVEVDDGI